MAKRYSPQRSWLKRRLLLLAAALAASCGVPTVTVDQGGLRETCLASIATQALANPHWNTIAANFAGPLGLVPSSDPNADPYRSKQVEFGTPDRSMHYLAVDGPEWTKAVLIRAAIEDGEQRILFLVIDRQGELAGAGIIRGRDFSLLNISAPDVLSAFETEQDLWVEAGQDAYCR